MLLMWVEFFPEPAWKRWAGSRWKSSLYVEDVYPPCVQVMASEVACGAKCLVYGASVLLSILLRLPLYLGVAVGSCEDPSKHLFSGP